MNENNTQFPTGKPHISFSEIKQWKECGYRHKLVYIDKIDTFEDSPYLHFGTAVHEGCSRVFPAVALLVSISRGNVSTIIPVL